VNDKTDITTKAPPAFKRKKRGVGSAILTFLKIVIPLVVLAAGIGVCIYFVKTAPKAEQKEIVREAELVQVRTVQKGAYRVSVNAMGTVIPAKRTLLQPRISGQVTAVSAKFVPGGRFDSGETIVKIDQDDYDLIVKQRAASVVKAEHDLKIEQGQQIIAKREFELLGNTPAGDSDLILRKPQLALAKAALVSAQAALDKAILDQKRTTLTAPFNAVILEKQQVDLGSQVSPVTQIAMLGGTDVFWVVASLPISDLGWLDIPGRGQTREGSTVEIFNKTSWPEGAKRTGRIVGLLSTLETQGRLARVLVEVKDPLCLKKLEKATDLRLPELLMGMYVSLDAKGRELKDVIKIKRTSLRDNDTVWVYGEGGLLEIHEVKVLRRGRDVVYVKNGAGLTDGQRIVISDLAVRIPGTPLKIDAPTTQPTTQPGDTSK
jgi:RND family efflux transporter MFP subunit